MGFSPPFLMSRLNPEEICRLTESIYGSTIPASLIPAATRGLLLHLEKLVLDNRVSRQPPPKGTGEKVDWSSMGISEKDVPKGWGDVWSLRGEAN